VVKAATAARTSSKVVAVAAGNSSPTYSSLPSQHVR